MFLCFVNKIQVIKSDQAIIVCISKPNMFIFKKQLKILENEKMSKQTNYLDEKKFVRFSI